jgi:hypothetical protein
MGDNLSGLAEQGYSMERKILLTHAKQRQEQTCKHAGNDWGQFSKKECTRQIRRSTSFLNNKNNNK